MSERRLEHEPGFSASGSLRTEGLSLQIGNEVIFEQADFVIGSNDQVIVLSEDNARKRMFLEVLSGEREATEGAIHHPKKARVSVVPQDIQRVAIDPEQTVREFYYESRGLDEVEKKLFELYDEMSQGDKRTLAQAGELQELYASLGGYGEAESEIETIIKGLAVNSSQHDAIALDSPVRQASSGQRAKLLIGRALFEKPDFLFMEDPSAHLDAESRKWLARYLRDSKQGALMTSTDEAFATEVASRVIEITNFGRVISFDGNLTEFNKNRDALLEREQEEVRLAAKEIAQLEETAARFKRWGDRSDDVSRRRKVTEHKIERKKQELESMPGTRALKQENIPDMAFLPEERGSDRVLAIENLIAGYGAEPIVEINDLVVHRGERVVVTGVNGSGKSTFLKALASELGIKQAELECASDLRVGPSIKVGYYSPDLEPLEHDESLGHYLSKDNRYPSSPRRVMRYWGFNPDEYDKPVSHYRAKDEIARIRFAKIMTERPNFLVLDEPTSQLSIGIKKRLLEALEDYSGTILFVAHDKDLPATIKPAREITMPHGTARSL